MGRHLHLYFPKGVMITKRSWDFSSSSRHKYACCEILVSGDMLQNIMDNKQEVLFAFYVFVESAEIRDLLDSAIYISNNESRPCLFRVTTFLKNSNTNHVLDFLLVSLTTGA